MTSNNSCAAVYNSHQLAIIRDAILRIRENVKEPASYTEVRTLLEIMTDNPRE